MTEATVPYLLAMPRPSVPRRLWDRSGWSLAIALEVVAIIALWEYLVVGAAVWNRDFLPAPTDIAESFRLMAASGYLLEHLAFSLQNFVIGYLLASVVGVALGLLMGTIPFVSLALGPFVWAMYATPRIAIAPLLVIWLGFGAESKVVIIVLMTVFPVLLNVMVGTKQVDQSLLRAARVFGATRMDLYRKVILPFTLPYTLTGLRLGISRALIGVVVGEFIGSAAGLGYMIVRASAQFDLATSFAVVAILLLIANVTMTLLDMARRRVAPWYRESSV